MCRANAVGKMVLTDLLEAGLHTPSMCKRHSICEVRPSEVRPSEVESNEVSCIVAAQLICLPPRFLNINRPDVQL